MKVIVAYPHEAVRWLKMGDQRYPDLDGYEWCRKTVSIPADWNGKDVWFKLGTVNDTYELFVNSKSVSIFGQANISVANRPTFTEVKQNIKYGESNQIAIRVNYRGSSGGLWRLLVILTIDENEATRIGALYSHHEGVSEGFHTVALEWTPEKYAFFVDGYKYYEYKNAISHIEESIIFSFEQCSEAGLQTATLPDSFIVDYVKVYKKK